MSSPLRRIVATLLAPWFAVVSAQPAAFHECAMHSPGSARQAAAAATAPMTHAGHTMAGHAMPAADAGIAHRHGATPSTNGHAAQCTCDEGCCVASAAAAPPAVAELSFAPVSVRREAPATPVEGVRPTVTPHVLPFANGPPARV